jgi:superfamily II RNA helicase
MEQEDEYLDPVEKKYRELDRRIAQFEEEKSQQQIEREIAGLQDRYPDFDVKEVVQVALQRDTTDLEGIYKQLAFDKMVNEARMAKLGKERQQQIEESVLESKRIASVINGGSSATASTTSDSFEPITSIAEAWAAAKRQMGAN